MLFRKITKSQIQSRKAIKCILIVTAIFQLIGVFTACVIKGQFDFLFSWTLGAVATPIGFISGSIIVFLNRKQSAKPTISGSSLLYFGAISFTLGAVAIIFISIENKKADYIKLFISEVKEISTHELIRVTVLPEELNGEEYKYQIEDPQILIRFRQAVLSADSTQVLGHSYPIFEGVLVLEFSNSEEMKLRAMVFHQQPNDLFIAKNFLERIDENTYHGTFGYPIRVPNLGNWMVKVAPKGRKNIPLKNNNDSIDFE